MDKNKNKFILFAQLKFDAKWFSRISSFDWNTKSKEMLKKQYLFTKIWWTKKNEKRRR